jgi:hypothetical protein
MVDYYAIDCSGENVCGTDLGISFFHGKKKKEQTYVGGR